MNRFCPLYTNPEVKKDFNEIIQALGGEPMSDSEFRNSELRKKRSGVDYQAMESAYKIWEQNNGNSIDLTKDGQKSLLFKKLLAYTNGNRSRAIQYKSIIYSNGFKQNSGITDREPTIDELFGVGQTATKKPVNINSYLDRQFTTASEESILGQELSNKLANGEKVSSKDILSHMMQNGVIPSYLMDLAQLMLNQDIDVVVGKPTESGAPAEYQRLGSTLTSVSKVRIVIDPIEMQRLTNKKVAQIFMHEVIHAVTEVELKNNPNSLFSKRVRSMYKMVKEMFPQPVYRYRGVFYGLNNEYEFITEFLTNKSFRDAVVYEVNRQKSKTNNIFKISVQFLRSIFNFIIGKADKNNITKLEKYFINHISGNYTIKNSKISTASMLQKVFEKLSLSNMAEEQLYDNAHAYRINMQYDTGAVDYARDTEGEMFTDAQIRRKVSDMAHKTSSVLRRRLAAINVDVADPAERSRQSQIVQSQIDQFESEQTGKLLAIYTFLTQTGPEIRTQANKILKLDRLHRSMDANEYMKQMHTDFASYEKTLKTFQDILNHDEIVRWLLQQQDQDKLFHNAIVTDIAQLNNLIANQLSVVTEAKTSLERIRMRVVNKELRKIGQETQDITMGEFLSQLERNGVQDINYAVAEFGDLGKASNDAVRALVYMVNKAQNDADRKTAELSQKLIKLQENLSQVMGDEHVGDLYERDDKGYATGYLVRKYNYGLFYKDYREFIRKLNQEVGRTGNDLVSMIPPEDDEARKIWSKKKNEWLGQHCYRRFKPEYYEAYEGLSRETQAQYNIIQTAIRNIKETCLGTDGFYHYEDLTDDDWERLQDLYSRKRYLKSDYYDTGELKQEGTVDYKIAKELQHLDEVIGGGEEGKKRIKRAVEKWKAAKLKKIDECGGMKEFEKGRDNDNFNWKLYDKWNKRNSRYRLKMNDDNTRALVFDVIDEQLENQLIYQVYDEQGNGDGGARYEELRKTRAALLSPARDQYTQEVNNKRLTPQARAKLKDIEKEMRSIRREAKKKDALTKQLARQKGKLFKKYLKSTLTDSAKLQLRVARQMDYENPGILGSVMKQMGTYTGDDTDPWHAYSWFTKLVARPEYEEEFMEEIPGDNWIERDDGGNLREENFDENEGMSMIPKGSRYDNSKIYNKIQSHKNLKKLYDTVKDTIKEANELQSVRNYHDDYLLPQITGDALDQITNRSKWKTAWDYVKYGKLGKAASQSGRIAGAAISSVYNTEKNGDDTLGQAISEAYIYTDEFGNEIPVHDKQPALDKNGKVMRDQNGDIIFEESPFTKPTGMYADDRELSMVPIYYTHRLAKPEQITKDLIGAVCEYYYRSQLFANRHQIKDVCETIVDVLKGANYTSSGMPDILKQVGKLATLGKNQPSGKIVAGATSNTYKAARKFLDMNLYDIRSSGNYPRGLVYFGRVIRMLATVINLGLNPCVAAVGLLTEMWTDMINGMVGMKYGKGWFFKHPIKYLKSWLLNQDNNQSAGREVMWSLIKNIADPREWKNRSTNDVHQLIMRTFNISDQLENSYKHSNRAKFLEWARSHSIFGMMTLSDYIAKGHIAESVLMSYKLVDGHFRSKQDLLIGMSPDSTEAEVQEIMKKYDQGITLRSIMYAKDGKLKIKDGYQAAYDEVINVVQNRIKKYAASADGVATTTQKAAITSTFIGSCILMHRQYLPLMLQERFGKTYYDLDTQEWSGGILRLIAQLLYLPLVDARNQAILLSKYKWLPFFLQKKFWQQFLADGIGEINFLTENSSGISKAINKTINFSPIKQLTNWLSGDQKDSDIMRYMPKEIPKYVYKGYIKQIVSEVALYKFIIVPLCIGICSLADDDDNKDNLLLQWLAFVARRFQWESFTPYRFSDTFNNIKTVTAATSASDAIQALGSAIYYETLYRTNSRGSLFQTFDSSNGTIDEDDLTVKRGVYKDWKKWQKALIKATPFHSPYEQIYGSKAKRKYFENKIMVLDKNDPWYWQ